MAKTRSSSEVSRQSRSVKADVGQSNLPALEQIRLSLRALQLKFADAVKPSSYSKALRETKVPQGSQPLRALRLKFADAVKPSSSSKALGETKVAQGSQERKVVREHKAAAKAMERSNVAEAARRSEVDKGVAGGSMFKRFYGRVRPFLSWQFANALGMGVVFVGYVYWCHSLWTRLDHTKTKTISPDPQGTDISNEKT